MNGYLTFLKGLSEYQQRAEIGRLAFFSERGDDSSLEADILKDRRVSTFSETLGINPSSWEFELKHYAEEPDCFGTPMFGDKFCAAPCSFRYNHLDSDRNLIVDGIIYIDADASAKIGTLTCLCGQKNPEARRRRLELAGINPDTLETVSHCVEMSGKVPYLDYIKGLLPQQRRDAIFELAELEWGTDNPKFLAQPKLARELQRLGISALGEIDKCHEVGPVEFKGGQCTAPLTYYLYGEGEASKYDEGGFGYFVEVHILASIANKPGAGGGDISIQDIWWRIESIDDLQGDEILLIVP
jgi:hypothetical protein